jgi:Ankyrin repeat
MHTIKVARRAQSRLNVTVSFINKDQADLFYAIEKGDFKKVATLCRNVPGLVNQYQEVTLFGATFTWAPIHAAAYHGSSRVIDELVQAGADIEMEDTWYKGRPLAWATFGAHPKICRILIQDFRADMTAKNIHGQVASDLVPDLTVPSWRAVFIVYFN